MENLPVNITDIAVIVIIAISAVAALIRGFVHEMLSMVSWIGAGIATAYGIEYVIPYARELTTIQPLADIGAGVTIFVIVLIILSLGTRMISKRIQDSSLGALDRSLGVLFGLARGALLVCIAWLGITIAVPREDLPEWLTEARSLPLIEAGAAWIEAYIPEDMLPEQLPEQTDLTDQYINNVYQLIPKPKDTPQDEESGYKDGERKDLQRLIESAQ